MTRRLQMLAFAMVCFVAGWGTSQLRLPAAWGWQAEVIKNPTRLHAMNLPVRMANEPDFTASTIKYGIEVYRDENNGNLIYICETGAISVVPAKP